MWFSSPHSRGTGSKHGACFAGLQGVFLSQPTMGIRTQGAQKMPWQDLRTAREGGNGFDLRFGACAVAVSLGVGRLWPRNPLTGSARSVAFPRVSRLDCDAARSGLPGSLCGRQCDVRVLAAKRPGRHKNCAPALLSWKYFVRRTRWRFCGFASCSGEDIFAFREVDREHIRPAYGVSVNPIRIWGVFSLPCLCIHDK